MHTTLSDFGADRQTAKASASRSNHAIDTARDADEILRTQVLGRLSQTALRRLGIQIHVQNGLVRLCGSLRDSRLRAHAEWLVFTTEGVQAVCSDWQVNPGQSPDPQCH